jgi:tellurite resistance protein TerC
LELRSAGHIGGVATETQPTPPKLVRKLQAQRATHKDRHKAVRVAFVLAGSTLLLGGLAMLLLPGPAFVVIPIGLALLSLEFCWAGRLLDKSLVKADQAKQKAADASRTSKVLTGAGASCGGVAAVVVVAVYNLPGPL